MCTMNVHSFLRSKPAGKLQMKPVALAMAIIGSTASSHTIAYMEVNSDTYASISRPGEIDTYIFRVPTSQLVDIYTSGSTDTVGTLLNSSGSIVVSNDDQSTSNRNFKISHYLSAGIYRINVRHYSSSGTGGYRLYLRGTTTSSSDDHGNSRSSATDISLNSRKFGKIDTPGDVDYFKIRVPTSQRVDFYTSGSTDTFGTLYDSSGREITYNDDTDGQNFKISRTLNSGTYYIAIRHYSRSKTGTYQFQVNGYGGYNNSGSNDDHGNSRYSATRIALGSSRDGRIERGGDIDYFQIRVNGSQNISLTTNSHMDTYGILYDQQGNVISIDDDTGEGNNFYISTRLNSGTYYLAVKGYDSSTTGSYRLRTSVNSVAISAPTLRYPSNGSSGLDNATFRWNPVSGADRYRIVISQDSTFSGFDESNGTCSNCYTTVKSGISHTSTSFNLPNHRYYWKVGSVVNGRVVAWSEARNFISGNASRIFHPLPNGTTLSNGRCQLGTPCIGSSVHRGVDLMASENSNVYSMCSGTVKLNATNRTIWNSFLIVKHNCNGTEYYGYYGHISSNLSEGSSVSAGQVIGNLKYYPKNGYNNTHLHMGIARSYHSTGWGYGSTLSDFIDFRDILN